MPRPVNTKGDIERAVKGVIAAGLQPGKFEVRIGNGYIRILPWQGESADINDELSLWDSALGVA